jgi:diguanylate cyclase (GGDEF)-like protein/PAS domain S-box-containing protein
MKVFDRNMLDILPFGIGYIRLLTNQSNVAADYVFFDVNSAFEKLTGLSREEILGAQADNVLRNTIQSNFNWILYFVNVSNSEETLEIQCAGNSGRLLKISAAPSGREIIAIIIQEIPEEMPVIRHSESTVLSDNSVFHCTHDAISLVGYSNGEFRYISNNAVHQQLTGLGDISGLSPVELLGDEVGGTLQRYYEQCMKVGLPVTYEQVFDFKRGQQTWQTKVTPIFHDGEILYLLCSSRDITELKTAQGGSRVLSQRLHSMFHQHTAVMLMIEPVSGKIVDANPAACDFYEYSMEELLSLYIEDINILPPDEVERQRLNAFQEKKCYFLFPHRLKNGEIRLVDVYSCPISDGERELLYSIIYDVTDREILRNELFQEKEVLQTTLQSIGDGVVTTDSSGMITGLNIVAQEITGWKGDEAMGRSFSSVFLRQNEETGRLIENPIQRVLETGRIIGLANHTVLINRQDRAIPIADSAAPIKGEDGKILGVVMVFRDVSSEREQNSKIRFLSYHDALTGLYNRRYIEEMLNREDFAGQLPLSVIMGDVNGLKITNDVFGHSAGDALLQHVAGLLNKYCHADDLIARWGGDEFVVLMPRTSLGQAEQIIETMKSNPIALDESGLQLSLSLGCAVKDSANSSIHAVMREAEENMYHQKLLDGKSYRNAIINTLLATLYEKSMETEEHSKRIDANCHSIGQKLHLSSKEMDELSLLAILHDIGKVGVNPNILKKPGPLTPAEWEEMKRHPEIEYRIVQATPELANVADYILSHHERWDGTGYPRGLKGHEIPLVCRILAITDAFDAMTNDRVYRAAKSSEEAIAELIRGSGAQFDPEIVRLFVQILQTERETIPN